MNSQNHKIAKTISDNPGDQAIDQRSPVTLTESNFLKEF